MDIVASGDKLRDAIQASGISVKRLSEESGVARSTIVRMMRTGDGMLYSWKAVAGVLGVGVDDLLEDRDGR